MFEGIHTAIVTPFSNGEIDETSLRGIVERQIEAGVHGLVPCGSTGESATLSHEEHRKVVEIVIEAVGGRIAVIAGTGSNSTAEAVALTRHAKDAGADGALLLSPYYNKPTQEGIYQHYAKVAADTRFPLIVYNIPGRTASNISPETLGRLAALEHVVAVKEACGDLDQIAHVVAACGDDFAVLSGDDSLTLPLMAVGGQGCISTSANAVPREMLALYDAMQASDLAGAQQIHHRLLPLFDVLFCETNPIPLKEALHLMGQIGPEIRLPLTRLTEPNRERLQVTLKDLGLL